MGERGTDVEKIPFVRNLCVELGGLALRRDNFPTKSLPGKQFFVADT